MSNIIPVDFRAKKRVNGIGTSKLGQSTIKSPFEVMFNEKVAENTKRLADEKKRNARNLVIFGALLGIVICRVYVDLIGLIN